MLILFGYFQLSIFLSYLGHLSQHLHGFPGYQVTTTTYHVTQLPLTFYLQQWKSQTFLQSPQWFPGEKFLASSMTTFLFGLFPVHTQTYFQILRVRISWSTKLISYIWAQTTSISHLGLSRFIMSSFDQNVDSLCPIQNKHIHSSDKYLSNQETDLMMRNQRTISLQLLAKEAGIWH